MSRRRDASDEAARLSVAVPGQLLVYRLDARLACLGLATLTVAALVIGAVFSAKLSAIEDDDSSRDEALAAATEAVPALLSYDASTIKNMVDANAALMTDDFASEYGELVEQDLRPTVVKEKLATDTQIATASIVSVSGSEATVLLFLNQLSSTKGMKVPSATGSRVRAILKLQEGNWLLDDMEPI